MNDNEEELLNKCTYELSIIKERLKSATCISTELKKSLISETIKFLNGINKMDTVD